MRIYIEDVEKVLQDRFDPGLKVETPSENQQTDQFLNTFLKQKFNIKINQKDTSYRYLGKEY